MNYIVLIATGIVGIFLGKYLGVKLRKRKLKTFDDLPKSERTDIQEKAQEALNERTENRKNKILQYMANEKKHRSELVGCNLEVPTQGITCNKIEKLLEISDNTARKYLSELEDENKIEQVDNSKRESVYKLI